MPQILLSVSLRDGKGLTSTVQTYIPDDAGDIGQVTAVLNGFAGDVATLTSGRIVGQSWTYQVDPPPGVDPPVTSDVEEGALFIFNSDVNGVSPRLRLPTFLENLIVDGSRSVNIADPPVSTFVTNMTSGYDRGDGTLVVPTDYRGAELTGIKAAYEQFTKSRNLRR